MSDRVLLLAPSRGLGGGVERFVDTVEVALADHAVSCHRLDLRTADRPLSTLSKLGFVRQVVRAVRRGDQPVRLVLGHPHLLPVLTLVARLANFRGATVILHGCEIWSGPSRRVTRWLRRPDVRAVAGSSFSAGALAGICRASVLNPGVSAKWYDTLVAAGAQARAGTDGVDLVTTFRLADWRDKGLETLLRAVQLLGDERVRLTVCGSGPVPAQLREAVRRYRWCRILPDLSDQDLARRLAEADLFVLATRTRHGAGACGEGFGLVLLEAQLAGTPVVAPAYGGGGDAFQHGLTGLAPTDESPEALASVLGVLLADDERRQVMGRAAAQWSGARFDPAAYSAHAVRTILGTPALEETCAASAV